MDKQFQEFQNFVTSRENRAVVIAIGAAIVVAVIGTMFTTKRGKAKR